MDKSSTFMFSVNSPNNSHIKNENIVPVVSRNNMSPRNAEFDDEEVMYVITRTGKKELLDPNQITSRLQNLINRKPKIHHVNPYELMLEVNKGLKSGITTYEIDEYAANASASLSTVNPYYLKIAARIAIDNHQKNTIRSFVDKMRKAYLHVDDEGVISPLLNSTFFKYVEENQDVIELIIDYSRDFLLDFFGFRTFQKAFSLSINKKPIERPQDMFMRTAITLHMNTKDSVDEELADIKNTYDLLSNKFYTHASPTYFNAGGTHQQYASCFLLGSDDSRAGIMKTADDMSQISKWAGGLGVHVNSWRGTGARIRTTNGNSSGIVPFLRIYNDTMKAFNQGGRRPGSAAIYLMPHHPDFLDFIQLRRNTGNDEERIRDLFYAVWLPDLFMQRVEKNETWSFFDPDKSGDLSSLWGTDYTTRYTELEKARKYVKQVPAREIWALLQTVNDEVGHPYICYSDNANKCNMQSNIGVLKSSNLCTEVFLVSSSSEYAVCILSSIALPNFVFDGYSVEELAKPEAERRMLNHEFPTNPYFDFRKFMDVAKTITTNLNLVIDKTFHPVIETKRGNDRHRPIGVGVQGLDDCYAKMRFPFDSNEARKLNKEIFEALYFATLSQSTKLARFEYRTLVKKCKAEGSVTVTKHLQDSYVTSTETFTDPATIPKKIAAYPSIDWNGGSPISHGIFHWELHSLEKDLLQELQSQNPQAPWDQVVDHIYKHKIGQDKLSGMFDWEGLREHILQFGVKNSLLVALMPTASTSQLLGNNECFEPYTTNIYSRKTLAGEYIVVKKYLVNDLYNLGIWSQSIKEYLLLSKGSIQNIEGVPEYLKKLYPTVWEIDQEVLVDQAIDRQPFVDQGQSLNLYYRNTSTQKKNKIQFKAWKGGLKTGKYYQHSEPAMAPQAFTIDPIKQKEMQQLLEKNKTGTAFLEPLRDVCEVCSS